MVRWAGIRGNVPVDPSGAFEPCAAEYGRRAGHTFRMAAHRRAVVAAMGVLMALVCSALASRKPWSRHVVIAMFALIIVYATILGTLSMIRHSIMWRALINATVFGCLSCWYFYLKPNVVQYFRTLKGTSKL